MHDAQNADRIDSMATFIATFIPADNVITEHRCVHGRYCAVCKSGPNAAMAWPCTTYLAAEQARTLQQMRSAGR